MKLIRNKLKSQTFNDGVVKIYKVENIAEPGKKPAPKLTNTYNLRYGEKTVGMQRFYKSLEAGVTVERALRCQRLNGVSPQDVALPIDGKQYRIVSIKYPEDIVPPVMDLFLSRLERDYDVS